MLNAKLSRDAWNSLPDDIKAHYVQKGEEYVLDVQGDTPAMTELRSQLTRATNEQLKAVNAQQLAEGKIADAENTAKAKYEAELKTANERVAKLQESTVTARRDAIVNEIASKFKQPSLFAAAIKNQVEVAYNEKGELVEKFVNEKGEAITLEQLTDAYCKNPEYSAMLTQPTSTVTMPTNGGQQPQQKSQSVNTFSQPQFGGQSQQQPSQSAAWGYDAKGKPAIFDYSKMTDADTKAYLEATTASAGNA